MAPLSHALLLGAGLGTRLRPLTLVRAKPAIPVAGIPMVRRIIGWLAASGVHEVVINLHHRPETIASRVGDGSDLGVRVRYSWEQPVVLGSAGGPRQALDILGADAFFIVNGDTLTDASVEPLAAAHQSSGALVTMAVIPNTEPHRYSGLRVAADGAVLGVVPRGSTEPSYHFIGLQAARRAAFAELPPGRPANSVGEVYDRMIARWPGSIRAHVCDARFWDIGTVADYWATERAFRQAAADESSAPVLGGDTHLADSLAWDDVVVGDRATITRCILTDGVRVEPGAVYSNMILMRGAAGQTVAVPFSADHT